MNKTSYPSQYIQTSCTILRRFAPTAYRAVLPNGKETVAFVQKRESWLLNELKEGDQVAVTICPADFERAKITSKLSN